MKKQSLIPLKVLLVALISSVTITGISFIDDKIWNLVFALVGILTYAIVGFLYSIGALRGANAGKETYAAVFLALLIVGFFLYQGIVSFQNWVLSWPLAVKIIMPTVLGTLIVAVVVLLIKARKKEE